MGVSDQPGETKPQTAHRWTTQVMSHFVTVQDEAARSTSLSYVARATTLVCLGIQIFVRLFGNNMSQVSELLVSQFAESLLLVLIAVPTLLFAFFVWSCFVPSGKRLQRWTLESGLPHILLTVYVALHMINALLVLPVSLAIYARVLFWTVDSPGGYRQHIYQALMDKMSVAAMSLLYVMIVPTVISVFAALGYSSFGISLLRSGDFFSSSNRAIFLVLPGSLFITMVCNTLTFNMEAPFYSAGPGIFLNVFSLGLSLLGILIASYYTVFYHRGYRRIILQGNWMLFVSTLFDMIYSGMERRGSMRLALFMFAIFTFGSRLISNLDYFVQVIDPQSEYISLRMILCLEQAFYEYGLGNPALNTMMLKVKMYLVQNRDPTKVGPVSRSSSEIESSNQELIGSYLFNLFDKACWSSSKMNFMLGLHFANYLSSQKTNYLYLAILIRKMKDTDLSFSESFHIHRLETLITQSLKKKEIESSGSIHDQRRAEKTPSAQAQKTSLNLYKTVETINLYEQLMKSMRKQIDLVVSFYEHLEQPTTWIVKLHEIVEQINKGRVVCSELFDRVDEASSSMQAFHILPYALFLEQTENNFEKGTELVKYYDSKTNMMFKHLGRSIRESLLENSITLVVEAEKGRLGNIVFTSRNMRQAFGPEVPDIDGQSLDLFFNPDMAKVHQMELERFLGKLDKEYLGYRQQRYITFGNNIYYRVTVVTKFVPHIEDGFRLVLLIKNLSLDLVDGNPLVMNNIGFAVDDNFTIVGVGYNKNLLRSDHTLNPSVEALIGQPLEVVSPESKIFVDAYLQCIQADEDPRTQMLSRKRLLLSAVGERKYRRYFNREDVLTGATSGNSKALDKTQTRFKPSKQEEDLQDAENNVEDDEIEQEVQDLEEEVQALKAGISGSSFPPNGAPVTLQLVNIQQETLDPATWNPEITVVPAKARIELMRINCSNYFSDFKDAGNAKRWDRDSQSRGGNAKSSQRPVDWDEPQPSTARNINQNIVPSEILDVLKVKILANLAMVNLTLIDGSNTDDYSSINKVIAQNEASNQLVGLGLFNARSSSVLQTEPMKVPEDTRNYQDNPLSEYEPERETAHPGLQKFQGESTLRSSLNSLPSLKKDAPAGLTAPKTTQLNPIQEAFLGLHYKLHREGSTPKPSLSRRGSTSPPLAPEYLEKPKLQPSQSSELVTGNLEELRPPASSVIQPMLGEKTQNISSVSKSKSKQADKHQKEQSETFKRYLAKMYEQKYRDDKAIKSLPKDMDGNWLPGETRMPKKSVLQLQIFRAKDQEDAKSEAPTDNHKLAPPIMKTSILPAVKEFNTLFGRSSSNNNGDFIYENGRMVENNQKSNSRSVNRSKQQDLLGNNQQAAKKQDAVLDQGSMRSSNRTSHTGSRSHLVIRRIMKNPKINRLPQISIFLLLASMICLTHVFQEFLKQNFADTFDEVNSLQHVFATLVSMDCFYKASLINILENQINANDYNMFPDRYAFLDPDLLDIQQASVVEFEYHITRAETQHNKLLLGIQDLEPSNIAKFVTADIDVEVRVPEADYDLTEAKIQTRVNNMNPIQISLLILYNLHVWWDKKVLYGDWGAYNYYYYAVESWLTSVTEVFSSFNGASLDTIDYLKNLSIYMLVSFSILTQSLLGLLYFQARTIRRGMIGTMKNLENLRMFEVLTKQDRLRYLKSILADVDDLEEHRRKIVSILRGMRNQRMAHHLETSVQAGPENGQSETKLKKFATKSITSKGVSQVFPNRHPVKAVAINVNPSKPEAQAAKPSATGGGLVPPVPDNQMAAATLNTPSTDRRHISAMYKMKRENKDTSYMLGNKIKILPSQWLGLGTLLVALVLIIEVQVGLNILTSERQRSSAVSYTNWMNVNQDYFLYVFYLNNLEAVIYIDSAGDMDLIELVPDLGDLILEYFEKQRQLSSKLIKEIRGMDANTRQFGFTKFFSNPCDYLDRTIYEVDRADCLKFGGGVVANGYLNFMDYTRILVEQVSDNWKSENVTGLRISNTTSFLTFVYFNKVINRPMFEIVREEMVAASDNVNDVSDAFVELFGTTFQSMLSASIMIIFFFLIREVDYHTGLCYSIFLLLPEETYTINHYIRGFIKRLDT